MPSEHRYVATQKSSHSVWHADADCHRLDNSTARQLQTGEVVNKDLSPCPSCAGKSDDQTHEERDCPVCEEPTASLGYHLRVSCEGT